MHYYDITLTKRRTKPLRGGLVILSEIHIPKILGTGCFHL